MTEAETLARLFHDTYERLAPMFDYETRRVSAVPWEEVPESNRLLMIATAAEVLTWIDTRERHAYQSGYATGARSQPCCPPEVE